MKTDQADQPAQNRKVARLASGTFVGTLIGAALMFVNEILVARLLGVERYGLYALGLMAARVGEILCMLGLRVGVLHFVPIFLKDMQSSLVAGIIRACTVVPALAAAIYVTAVWLLSPLIDESVFNSVGGAPYMNIIVLAVPAMCLSEIFGNITRAYGYARYHVITRSLVPPLVYMLLISLIRTLDGDTFAITLAFVAAHAAGLVAGVICVWLVTRTELRGVRPTPVYRRLYTYSFPIFINGLLYVLMAWTGLWFIGMHGSAAEIGMYRAAMQITIVFEMIALALNAATAHIFPVAIIEKDHDRLQRTYGQVIRLVSLLALSALVVMVSVSGDLLGLLGNEFRPAWIALTMLAVAQTILCCSSGAGFLLVIGRHQTVETFNALLGVICNVALCWLLVPHFGIHGAAAAAVLSFTLFAALRIRSAARVFEVRTMRPLLTRTLVVTAAACAVSLGLIDWLPFSSNGGLASIAGKCAISASIMSLMLWTWSLSADERNALRGLLPGRLGGNDRTA